MLFTHQFVSKGNIMRGSKAKAIRKTVATLYMPAKIYSHQQHRAKLLPTGQLDANGNMKMMKVVPVTTSLGGCQRAVYQELKKMV